MIYRRMRPLLGTYVEIGTKDLAAEAAVALAFSRIELIQNLLSFHDPQSDLSRLNLAGTNKIYLHPESRRVLCLAKLFSAASRGLFNPTVGGELERREVLPSRGARTLTGTHEDLEIEGPTARIRNGVAITLDGIAKGYAVDRAISALKSAGLKTGWVNAGGDLRVFGDLTMPIEIRGGARVAIRNTAIASSVVLPNEMESPRAGTSFPGMIVSGFAKDRAPSIGCWTVLSRSAWRADALTKVAALAPEADRRAILQSLGGVLVEAS